MKNLTTLFFISLVGTFAVTLTPANAAPPASVDDTFEIGAIINELNPSPLSDPAEQVRREMDRIEKVETEDALKQYQAAQGVQLEQVRVELAKRDAAEQERVKAEALAKAKRDAEAAVKEKAAKEAAQAEEDRVQAEIDAANSRNKKISPAKKDTALNTSTSVTPVAAAAGTSKNVITGGSAAMRCEVASGNSLLKPWVSKVRTRINAQFGEHTIGGTRIGDPQDHGQGLALDVMTKGQADGDAVAQWARANAGQLNITYVIWQQKIWSVERSSEGWRAMSDRGSVSANHYDHVHISFANGSGSCPSS